MRRAGRRTEISGVGRQPTFEKFELKAAGPSRADNLGLVLSYAPLNGNVFIVAGDYINPSGVPLN